MELPKATLEFGDQVVFLEVGDLLSFPLAYTLCSSMKLVGNYWDPWDFYLVLGLEIIIALFHISGKTL